MKNIIYNLIATTVAVLLTGVFASAVPNIKPVENQPEIKNNTRQYWQSHIPEKSEPNPVQADNPVENPESAKLIEKIELVKVLSPQSRLAVKLYNWTQDERQNKQHPDAVENEKEVQSRSDVKQERKEDQYLISVEKEASQARCCSV